MDRFNSHAPELDSPANDAFLITPDDGTDLAEIPRAILVGTGGNLRVTTKTGNTLTIPNVPAGTLSLRVTRVFATDTTASDLTALT